jgi:Ca2+-binding RTX toxin-like protein
MATVKFGNVAADMRDVFDYGIPDLANLVAFLEGFDPSWDLDSYSSTSVQVVGSDVADGTSMTVTLLGPLTLGYPVSTMTVSEVSFEAEGVSAVITGDVGVTYNFSSGAFTAAGFIDSMTARSAATGNLLVSFSGLAIDVNSLEALADFDPPDAVILAGADSIAGGTGADFLLGYAGNDTLAGGAGSDTLKGGGGDDTYVLGTGDLVIEATNAGIDLVKSGVSCTLSANVEKLTLTGTGAVNGTGNALANAVTGNSAGNLLKGYAGDDTILGGGGNDTMLGGDGADQLTGGLGKDILTGGLGNDRFDFNAITETASGTDRDVINDFAAGDKIDLATIDANLTLAYNQAFTLTTGATFTGFTAIGELFYNTITHVLLGNNDADAQADFSIRVSLSGLATLTAADFVL